MRERKFHPKDGDLVEIDKRTILIFYTDKHGRLVFKTTQNASVKKINELPPEVDETEAQGVD